MIAFTVAELINFGPRIAAVVRIKSTHLAHVLLLLTVLYPIVDLGVLLQLSPLTHYYVVLLCIIMVGEERFGLLVHTDVVVSRLQLVVTSY